MVWLCVAAVLTFACALPWPLRFLTAALVVAAGVPAVLRCVLLRGQSAVRALEWNGQPEGGFVIFLGPARRPLPAMPEGCRKYGASLWSLRFESPEGVYQVLVDARLQDARAIRRLGRRLFDAGSRSRGRSGRAAASSCYHPGQGLKCITWRSKSFD
jgi:hypothetical protein